MQEQTKLHPNIQIQNISHLHYSPYWLLHALLALLDYASSAHEIDFVHRPSVSQLSLYPMHGFLSNCTCCFPWAIHLDVFFFKLKKETFSIFLRFCSVFVNMGPYGCKKLVNKVFIKMQLFACWEHWKINESLKTKIKTLLRRQIAANSFQTSSGFSSQ